MRILFNPECVLYPVQVRLVQLAADLDNIKTAALEVSFVMLLHVVFRCIDQFSLFAKGDAFQAAAKGLGLTHANFNKYPLIAVAHNDVDFSIAAAEILFNQHQALINKMIQCQLFAVVSFGSSVVESLHFLKSLKG